MGYLHCSPTCRGQGEGLAAIPVENPRPADLAAAAAAAPVAVPASPGSPAESAAAATADSKPEAEADWLASLSKRFPPAEKE